MSRESSNNVGKPRQLRCTPKQVLARYAFRFTQGEKLVYERDQTALWMKLDRSASGV